MGTNSILTIIKGQEFKVVDKHFIGEDDIFLDQYKQAAEMLNTIVNESKGSAENHFLNEYENNIIAFCGERGEGKSSAMLTFINSLYEDYWEDEEGEEEVEDNSNDNKKENTDKEPKRYNLFKNYRNLDKKHFAEPIIVDPSQFDEVHNILDIILAKLYRNFSKKYNENNRCADEYIINELQDQFQKVYREVSMINNQAKMLDDEFDYEGNIGKLSKLGESTGLKEDFQKLIKQYLIFVRKSGSEGREKQNLIIAVDDLDLCNSNAYKMAEQIRKYLIIPQIVIVMAVRIEQLEMCVEENTIAGFKGIVGVSKQYDQGEQRRINTEIQSMSERYVAKLIPKARRIYLPKAQSLEGIQVIYKEKDSINRKGRIIWRSKENESLVNAVLHLIHRRTGMIFLPEKSGMSYLLPNNLRDMVNWIVLVAEMDNCKKKNVAKNDIKLKNVRKFFQFFYNEWLTKQASKNFCDELRSMEQMDSYHMNMNAKWLLNTTYDNCERKEEYIENNIKSDEQSNFWKVMQWIIRFNTVVFDFDAKCEAYALKVLYTMKINQWLNASRLSDVSLLVKGYIWGGEFDGVLPRTGDGINRSRFYLDSKQVMQIVSKKFNLDFIKDLNSESDSKQITVSNLSSEESIRKDQICALILTAMFTDINTQNSDGDEPNVLGTDKLIAGNRRMNRRINISLENYIVSLCDLEMLINKINIDLLNIAENDVNEIIKNMINLNKEEVECAQHIVANMDLASELIIYCKDNRGYKSKTKNAIDRTKKLIEKFFENIRKFMEEKIGKIYDEKLFKTIQIGKENIDVAQLYAEWFEQNEAAEYKKIHGVVYRNSKREEFREMLENMPNNYKSISVEEFLNSFRSNKTAEELKEELEKLAKDVYRYRGKYKKSPNDLNINQLCQLYEDALQMYCTDSDKIIRSDMKERYNQYAGRLKKELVIDEQED